MMDNPHPVLRPGGPMLTRWARGAHVNAVLQRTAPRRCPVAPVVTDEARFLGALPVIDGVTSQVCRRHRLSPSESDDFRSDVRLHFIDRNYEVLRQFQGRCALATYVTVVVQRVFLDWRSRLWGRWRPSSEARRLGPTAVLIERLVIRDGWTVEQALETLRVNHGVVPDGALRTYCEKLAGRAPGRRLVSEEAAGEVPSQGPSADANVVRAEQEFLAKRVQASLDRARLGLAPIERLILKMRFEDRMAIADIARALHLEQRPLYRTIERVLSTIGASMRADGVSKADVEALFDAATLTFADSGAAGASPEAGAVEPPAKGKGASW